MRTSLHSPRSQAPSAKTDCLRRPLYTSRPEACHSHIGTFEKFVISLCLQCVAAGTQRGEIVASYPPMFEYRLSNSSPADTQRRVQAVVALRVLEVIREQDVPLEVLESEDPAQTMPRRLGLSDVVERQIRAYREDVRKRVRLTDSEIKDLFRLVIRRPDSQEVFFGAGRLLAENDRPKRWSRVLPRRFQYSVARSRVRRRLKKLFGRRMGGFGRGPFYIEGRSLIFVESDPDGEACHFMSGFCQEILERTTGGVAEVHHSLCQGRGDPQCRWEASIVEEPMEARRAQADNESVGSMDEIGEDS